MIFERISRGTDGSDAYLLPDDLIGPGLNDGSSPTKSNFHIDGCSCMACHAHDDDGKLYQPGGVGTDAEDTIAGGLSTTARLTPGTPAVGEIDFAGDSDWFRITLAAGETYTFTTYLPGGGLSDSILTLRNSAGRAIATNDDANTGAQLLYSEITFTAATAGTYFLDVTGYQSATGAFFLSSSRPVRDDVAGSTATTASLTVGAGPVRSALNAAGDRDWYAVTLTAGETYNFTTSATGGAADPDTTLTLRDASGNVLAFNDDSSGTYSAVRFTATSSGTYYVDVGSYVDSEAGNYQLTASVAEPLTAFTNDQIADQLVNGFWGGPADSRAFAVRTGGVMAVNVSGLTEQGRFLARNALELWGDALGIRFFEVNSGGSIVFDDNEEGAFSSSERFNNIITSSRVNISTAWLESQGTTLDSYSFQTYLHEIGHALGLGHAGNYNSTANYGQDAQYLNDSWATTVMSYFDQRENTFFSNQGFDRAFAITPRVADILAVQALYGISTTTRTGDDVYGVGNTTGRVAYGIGDSATDAAGRLLSFTIIDNGGIDTLDYSSFSASQTIDLNAETFSSVGGNVGNMSIARGTVIENAIGGSGDDVLIGNEADNMLVGGRGRDRLESGDGADTLNGGAGNDTLDGGSNVDTAIVSGRQGSYTVRQTSTGVFTVTGADGTDTLTGVEFLQFDDATLRLRPGTGVSVNFDTADTSVYQSALNALRDFDGNAVGGDGAWLRIGAADVNGDGDMDQILVNDALGRFATVGIADDGLVYFDDHGWAGETRVAGIYIDPLVTSGDVVAGSDNDSQRRFQNDLEIENINRVLGADDYDGDGLQEVYFALNDGTAFLHAYMHEDGNIRYANYQSEEQVIEFLTANGFGPETYEGWFDNSAQEAATSQTDIGEDKTSMPGADYGWAATYIDPNPLEMAQLQMVENFV